VSGGPDDWSAVPAREPGHVADPAVQEARRTPDTSADGAAPGRVHGRPAPQYGEYAPDGWVNPVLVEQERREQERREHEARSDALPDRAAQQSVQGGRSTRAAADRPGPQAPGGAAPAAPPAGRFGAGPIDFVLTVGLLVIGLWSVVESLSIGSTASTIRSVVEQQYTELSDPGALSTAAVVRALVLVVLFVLVTWWSIRRLRARRWTFWVPLVGGVVSTVLGTVPVLVVIFQDPQMQAVLQRMSGG
jgi:hypothetical protein